MELVKTVSAEASPKNGEGGVEARSAEEWRGVERSGVEWGVGSGVE